MNINVEILDFSKNEKNLENKTAEDKVAEARKQLKNR